MPKKAIKIIKTTATVITADNGIFTFMTFDFKSDYLKLVTERNLYKHPLVTNQIYVKSKLIPRN